MPDPEFLAVFAALAPGEILRFEWDDCVIKVTRRPKGSQCTFENVDLRANSREEGLYGIGMLVLNVIGHLLEVWQPWLTLRYQVCDEGGNVLPGLTDCFDSDPGDEWKRAYYFDFIVQRSQ